MLVSRIKADNLHLPHLALLLHRLGPGRTVVGIHPKRPRQIRVGHQRRIRQLQRRRRIFLVIVDRLNHCDLVAHAFPETVHPLQRVQRRQ